MPNDRESALTSVSTASRSTGAVTLEQVASIARVSRATVSRVVNGDQRVGEPSRVAVEAAVRELGYVPNRAARSLVTRRSDSVAVVIPEPSAQVFGDPFFPRVLRGISDALAEESMQLVLLLPQERTDEERVERYLAAGHVRRCPAHLAPRVRSAACGAAARPRFRSWSAGGPPGSGIPYVDVDNRGGAACGRPASGRQRASSEWRRSQGRRTWLRARTAWPAIASGSPRPRVARATSSSRSPTSRSTVAAPRWSGCSRVLRPSTRCSSRPTSWRSVRWPRCDPPGVRGPR